MKRILTVVLAVSSSLAGQTIHFDNLPADKSPAGWTVAMTHQGAPPRWLVVRDATAPSAPHVLAQLSDDPASSRFPLAILDAVSGTNGTIRVKFKAVSGKGDQAAGIVWRFQDPDNYYLVRANALENNVVLYKVAAGARTAIAPKGSPAGSYGVKHAVPSGAWSDLAVEFRGNSFSVTFNGEKLFDAEDATFAQAGKVGLWTKADSVTYFDDFSFEKR
jgi:hypothetical protein